MSSYPRFNGFAMGFCNPIAEAEIQLSPEISLVPSVKIMYNSFALEARHYLPYSCYYTGFVSSRFSTRGNIGIGFGIRSVEDRISVDPTLGVSMDRYGNVNPFFSLVFSMR